MKVLPDRRAERRAPRRVHRGGAVQARVPAGVPAGLHRRAHHASEGPDAPGHAPCAWRPIARSRCTRTASGWGRSRPCSRCMPGALSVVVGPDAKGIAMTDGLLLIHAFPLDARMWEPQVAAFGDAIPVVTPNLPGFGGTPGAGDVMSMGAAAAACLQAADATGVDADGGLRALDGRLRRVRALAHGPPARDGSRAREHALRRGHAGGGRRPSRAGQPTARPRATASSSPAPPPLLRADAPDAALGAGPRPRSPTSPRSRSPPRRWGWPSGAIRPPTSARSTCPRSSITSDGDTLIPPEVTADDGRSHPRRRAGHHRRTPGTCRTSRPRRRSTRPSGASSALSSAVLDPTGPVASAAARRLGA